MDLTIAVCVYNAENYIEETLECLCKQTRKDFVLLIINDASTDRSVDSIKDFLKDKSIEYKIINCNENKGIANAREIALNSATTRYILFIDSDDLFKSTLVEKLYKRVSLDKDIMAVTCYSHFIDSNGKRISGGTFLGVKSKEEFFSRAVSGKLFFMPIHTLFDRETAIKAGGFCISGFPTGRPRYADYCEELDLWTRMSDFHKEGKYFSTVREPLYFYRKSNGLSSNHFNMLLKMRYTKNNVRRRRSGKENITFNEFYASLSQKELKDLKKEAFAADNLRNGAILLKSGNPFKGGYLILRSIMAKPSYFIDKVKHNL